MKITVAKGKGPGPNPSHLPCGCTFSRERSPNGHWLVKIDEQILAKRAFKILKDCNIEKIRLRAVHEVKPINNMHEIDSHLDLLVRTMVSDTLTWADIGVDRITGPLG